MVLWHRKTSTVDDLKSRRVAIQSNVEINFTGSLVESIRRVGGRQDGVRRGRVLLPQHRLGLTLGPRGLGSRDDHRAQDTDNQNESHFSFEENQRNRNDQIFLFLCFFSLLVDQVFWELFCFRETTTALKPIEQSPILCFFFYCFKLSFLLFEWKSHFHDMMPRQASVKKNLDSKKRSFKKNEDNVAAATSRCTLKTFFG